MELSLLRGGQRKREKRIFPRFPFCFLTFKVGGQVFEVKDISFSGMQLSLKDGDCSHKPGSTIGGSLRWYGESLDIAGRVKWTRGQRLGVHFTPPSDFALRWDQFFSLEKIAGRMRPLHKNELSVEFPGNLRCWLRSDGPVEIFVWCHKDGEISSFQFLFMETFLEWEDGKGLVGGRILTRRDLETPLVQEDEFVFQEDSELDSQHITRARGGNFFASRGVPFQGNRKISGYEAWITRRI